MTTSIKYCPCGSQQRYLDCCGLYLIKKQLPATPEALMRSRYTAYVEKNADYIRKTMREPALLHFNKKSILKSTTEWQGLQVIKTYLDPNNSHIGYVEFIARYKQGGLQGNIHELSEFRYEQNKWCYIDGIQPPL